MPLLCRRTLSCKRGPKYLVTLENTPLPDGVIDNNGVGVLQQTCQFHGYLSEPHARASKDLTNREQNVSHLLKLNVSIKCCNSAVIKL